MGDAQVELCLAKCILYHPNDIVFTELVTNERSATLLTSYKEQQKLIESCPSDLKDSRHCELEATLEEDVRVPIRDRSSKSKVNFSLTANRLSAANPSPVALNEVESYK